MSFVPFLNILLRPEATFKRVEFIFRERYRSRESSGRFTFLPDRPDFGRCQSPLDQIVDAFSIHVVHDVEMRALRCCQPDHELRRELLVPALHGYAVQPLVRTFRLQFRSNPFYDLLFSRSAEGLLASSQSSVQ